MNPDLAQQASNIKLFVSDIDGVWTDGTVIMNADGGESVVFSILDGFGLVLLMRNNIEIAIISGRDNPAVAARAKKLGVKEVHLGFLNKGDLIKKIIKPTISEKSELVAARLSAVGAVCVAGYFGINPPGFVAAVVALAFGLAAASFFPAIILGIFYKKMNKEGAIAGMIVGITAMLLYMMKYKLGWFDDSVPDKSEWWFGISPEGFGSIAMCLNFMVSIIVLKFTKAPPKEVQDIVENIRIPNGAGEASNH